MLVDRESTVASQGIPLPISFQGTIRERDAQRQTLINPGSGFNRVDWDRGELDVWKYILYVVAMPEVL